MHAFPLGSVPGDGELMSSLFVWLVAVNGSRLGFFEPIRRTINKTAGYRPDQIKVWSSIGAGAASGVAGGEFGHRARYATACRSAADPSPTVLAAIVGNPLFLVKARMQAYSPFNPVGVQHAYKGTWDGLKSIVKVDGVKGLWRGVDASMLRTAMGSSVSSHLPALSRGRLN